MSIFLYSGCSHKDTCCLWTKLIMLFSSSPEDNATPHCLKSLTKVNIHHIYSFSMLHKASYPIREVNEVGLILSPLDKSKLSVSFWLIMLERIKNWLLIIYPNIFPGVSVMLPCLQIPRFLFSTFQSCSLLFVFPQASGTSLFSVSSWRQSLMVWRLF